MYVSMNGLRGLGEDPPLPQDVASCPLPWETAKADYCKFSRLYYDTDEVYTFRFMASPAAIATTAQAMRFAKAFAESLGVMERDIEVRGIVLWALVPPQAVQNVWLVEVVYTTGDEGMPLTTRSVEDVAADMTAALRKEWPDLVIVSPMFLELLRSDAVSDWLAAPAVWSYSLFKKTGSGFTEAGGRGEGVWLGGTAARPQARMMPTAPTPIEPPPPSPGKPPPGKAPKVSVEAILGIAAVGGILWYAYGRKKRTQ